MCYEPLPLKRSKAYRFGRFLGAALLCVAFVVIVVFAMNVGAAIMEVGLK